MTYIYKNDEDFEYFIDIRDRNKKTAFLGTVKYKVTDFDMYIIKRNDRDLFKDNKSSLKPGIWTTGIGLSIT